MNELALLLLVIIVIGLILGVILLMRARQEQAEERWLRSRRTILLKILVPKNNDRSPAAAEHLFAALHGIYRADMPHSEHLSFEIAAREKSIEFYVQCPVELRDFIEGQIYAQYPTVDISEVTDYARVDLHDLKVASTELILNKPPVFPIKTFVNFEVDPLAGITGVLSKIGDQEQVWIQVIVRPLSDTWQNKGISYVAAARSGNLNQGSFFRLLIRGLIDVFRAPPAAEAAPKSASPTKLPASQELALKGIEEKATKLGYSAKIRLVALASDQVTAQAKIHAMTGAYKQFNSTNMNGFAAGSLSQEASSVEAYRMRAFRDEGMIFNIEELASLFHFPNASVETPNIVWAGAKKGEPPATLPIEGVVSPEDLTLFGVTDFRGARQKFGIKLKDRRQHMYAIGKSGTGKSTMLENMAIDDIRKGRGVAIVDPHGDFVNHVLDYIPANRVNDVIYFGPADKDYPVGFNILENVDPELKNIVASGVVGIFKKLFAESWGPRLEYILRNVILALLEYPNATVLGIMKIMVDKNYRARVMSKVKDPVIRDFFLNEFDKWDPKFRTEAIAPIQNKVGQFLSASTIRNIVGQPKSTFDLEEAMNSSKIILLDLSIGKIGEDAAALLGSMMITKIQLAAMRRANIEEKDRVDFYLYVDEFQNFATDSFAVILSEARKYRLDLIMTNQYIAQMPELVAKAIFGNIGTLISFRVGASDAVALVKEFEPVFEANDLINLDNHHIYAKMSIDGVTRPAFSAITLAPAADANGHKEKIIRISRERYSRPRDFVEKKILEASHEDEGPPAAEFGGEAPAAVKKTAVPNLEVMLEAERFEAYQDKEGKHWYFQMPPTEKIAGDSPTIAQPPAAVDSSKQVDQPKLPAVKFKPEIKQSSVPTSVPKTPRVAKTSSKTAVQSAPARQPKLVQPVHQSVKKLNPQLMKEPPVASDSKVSSVPPAVQPKKSQVQPEVQPLQADEIVILRD